MSNTNTTMYVCIDIRYSIYNYLRYIYIHSRVCNNNIYINNNIYNRVRARERGCVRER